MKKLLSYLLVIGILASLLTMTGCKKKKPDPTKPTGQTVTTSGTEPTQTEPLPTETEPTQTEPLPTVTEPIPTTEPTAPTVTDPTETTAPPCNHVPGSWIVEKTSTCTTEGSRYKSCTICGEKVETQAIPMLPHTPGQWIVDVPANCQQEGQQHQNCSQCDTKLIIAAIAKTEHTETVVLGKAPTATETGLTDGKKCTVCNETLLPQYVIPAGMEAVSFGYEVNSDKLGCSIAALDRGATGDVTVPETFAGYTVTGIGEGAFADCAGISGITLPATVTNIGNGAFSGCKNLTKIVFQGTTAQWNAITKGTDWDANTGAYTVTCSD